MAKRNLDNSKKLKNDEFYTKIEDIERELKNYKNKLKNKIIFANCDDPDWSNFYKYFELNFYKLGIKKLITTHFSKVKNSYKLELEIIDNKLVKKQTELKTNGDFRNPECIEILKESDIVVTNPPFSLFREYVTQLMEYEKKFLIIGNMNAVAYKDIFPLIKNNKIWIGCNNVKEFITIDKSGKEIYKKFGNVNWYTNLSHKKRENEEIFLYKEYNEKEFPKYDNYNAIDVSKIKDIPKNYFNEMGVPISFINKYNPKQFKILKIMANNTYDINNAGFPFVNNKKKFARIIIRRINENRT